MANPEPAPVAGEAQVPATAPTATTSAEAMVANQAHASAAAIAETPAPFAPASSATHCGNCGAGLHGKFCHVCGQKDFDFRRSFGAVLGELLETFLNFDGKLLRGMYALLFQPGKLTVDFLAGKRTSQVPPLRFYIFLSIVTFVWTSGGDQTNIRVAQSLDKELATKPELQREEVRASPIMQRLQLAAARPDEINGMFRDYLPQLFLLCVPALAFLLWVVFRRQRYTYLQHLVAAVHLQTFVLLLSVTAAGWGRIVGLGWSGGYQTMRALGLLYFFVYGFLALRRVYGEPAFLTLLKGLGVLFAYWCILMLAMSALVVIALLQL